MARLDSRNKRQLAITLTLFIIALLVSWISLLWLWWGLLVNLVALIAASLVLYFVGFIFADDDKRSMGTTLMSGLIFGASGIAILLVVYALMLINNDEIASQLTDERQQLLLVHVFGWGITQGAVYMYLTKELLQGRLIPKIDDRAET